MAEADSTLCAYCGTPLDQTERKGPRGRKRKFCDATCNRRYHYNFRVKPSRGTERPTRSDCAICGKSFNQKPTGSVKKFCSKPCRDRAQYAEKKADGRYAYKKKQPVRTCKGCGTLFLPIPGRGYSYCGDACKPIKQRQWLKQTQTICMCEVCSEPFVPKTCGQLAKYCNPSCRRKAHDRNGDRCVCAHCGCEFTANRKSPGIYCSNKCSGAALREAAIKRNIGQFSHIGWRKCVCCDINTVGPRLSNSWAGRFCQECRDILGNAIGSHAGRIKFLRARLWGKRCRVCGNIFNPPQETSDVCSMDCKRQTEEFKEERRAHKAKRRAMKKTNGPYESIRPASIFERDGWTCYICGIDTPSELRGSHDDAAPEMDHVIPLSAGGTHTENNVACACRKCNQEKSDRIIPAAIEMRRALALV